MYRFKIIQCADGVYEIWRQDRRDCPVMQRGQSDMMWLRRSGVHGDYILDTVADVDADGLVAWCTNNVGAVAHEFTFSVPTPDAVPLQGLVRVGDQWHRIFSQHCVDVPYSEYTTVWSGIDIRTVLELEHWPGDDLAHSQRKIRRLSAIRDWCRQHNLRHTYGAHDVTVSHRKDEHIKFAYSARGIDLRVVMGDVANYMIGQGISASGGWSKQYGGALAHVSPVTFAYQLAYQALVGNCQRETVVEESSSTTFSVPVWLAHNMVRNDQALRLLHSESQYDVE